MQIGVEEIDRKYDVLEKLGEGGMGTVYKVRHRYLDELRVIKTIKSQLEVDDDLQQRFLREARVAAKLRHPNIAIIHDFSIGEDGTAYIAMEYVEGQNIRQHQKSAPPLEVAEVLEVGRQTLDALAYLHSKQVVHRDISTDNLMLSWSEGRMEVKLIDLGLAKSLQNEQQWKTRTGMVVGKVRYISPEQLNAGMSGVEIDHRSDLYSFGVVLYELVTRQFPITGADEMSMIAGHLYRPPKSFDETDPEARVPQALRRVIMKALEKSPDNRFAGAEEFSRALTACGSQSPRTALTGGRTSVTTASAAEAVTRATRQGKAEQPGTDPAGAETATLVTAVDPQMLEGQQLAKTEIMDWRPAAPARRPWRAAAIAAAAAVVVALVAGWLAFQLFDQRSAPEPSPAAAGSSPAVAAAGDIFFGQSHALVIGNNNYLKLPLLETAINDARAVAELLERRYGFEVRLLEDADRQQLITALHDFNERLTGRDNLLVYYAGHGQLQGQSEYWQPIDADPDRTTNWISTRYEISGALKSSSARHILVIADSCYSGAMAGAAPPAAGEETEEQIRELVRRQSRLVLTSGGLSPVLDTGDARHSLFARALLEALRTNQEVIGVSRLFPAIRQRVSSQALERGGEQVPVLAPIPDSLDEGGEFFFVPQASSVG